MARILLLTSLYKFYNLRKSMENINTVKNYFKKRGEREKKKKKKGDKGGGEKEEERARERESKMLACDG